MSNVWLVSAVLALATFLFLVGYVTFLYPDTGAPLLGIGRSNASASAAVAPARDDSLQFAVQRFVGQTYNGDGEVAKLRPFRALSLLLVTLPVAYTLYRSKLNEERILA